jgi:hypothetical protein
MKNEMIEKLRSFKSELLKLKKEIDALKTTKVSTVSIRNLAESIANIWTEEIRSPLEHKFCLDKYTIEVTSEEIKKLFILSRPNNQKSSYLKCISNILKKFDDKFILPIQQMSTDIKDISDLSKVLNNMADIEESKYLKEAIDCALSGFLRASIVIGWCAAIDKLQKHVINIGYDKINNESTRMKNKTTGKYKKWNKEFNVNNKSELQAIFDSDLISIFESMEVFDSNQTQRLEVCFQYRNNSAHPGEAPIEHPHLISFFSDINNIILSNKKLLLQNVNYASTPSPTYSKP